MKLPKLTRVDVPDLWDAIPTSPSHQLAAATEGPKSRGFGMEQQTGTPILHHPHDLLRRLPTQVLEMVFCAERVIMGTLVCRWLRRELLTRQFHVDKMELRGPGRGEVQAKWIWKTLDFAQDAAINLHWEPCGRDKVFFSLVRGMWYAASRSGFGKHLMQLDLSNNSLGDEQAKQLGFVLRQAKCLTHLDLSNTSRGLMSSLRFCSALENLNLSNNDIGDSGAGRLASALRSCVHLKHLDLGYNKIGESGTKQLSRTMARFTTNLSHLNLSHNTIGDGGAVSLARALLRCSGLQAIHLEYTEISDVGAFSLPLAQCKVLSTLSFNNTRLSDVGVRNLVQKLKASSSLRSLRIGSNQVQGCHWAGGWGGSFFPGSLFLVPPGIILRIAQMNRGLTHLDLSGTGIGNQSLLNGMMQFSHSDGVSRVAASIAECGALRHLNLHNNNIKDLGELGSVLGRLGALESLDLGANKLGCAGAEVLAGVLARCSALATLHLGSNDVGDEGAAKLSEVLCGGLRVLDLSCNRVREAGAQRFAEALGSGDCHLRCLDLSYNAIGEGGVGVLVSAHEQRGGEGGGGAVASGCVEGGGEAGTPEPRKGLLLDLRGNYTDFEEETWGGDE